MFKDAIKEIVDIYISQYADQMIEVSDNKGGEYPLFVRTMDKGKDNEQRVKVIIKVVPIPKNEWGKYEEKIKEAPTYYNEESKGGIKNG